MFGTKSSGHEPRRQPTARVETIPVEFYAGANPLVTFKNVTKEISVTPASPAKLSPGERKHLDKTLAVGFDQPLHPARLLGNRRFLIIGGVVLGGVALLISIAVVWYQLPGRQKVPIVAPPAPVESAPAAVPTEAIPLAPSSTEPVPIPVSPITEAPLVFASPLLGDSLDTDNDTLTDVEEELFKTDPGVPDSDADTYTDGHELFNLYNPAGKTPLKLIDSGLAKEFFNPVFGYTIYYPTNWAVGAVDQNYRTVLFSTITGEYVEVRVIDKDPATDFAAWFSKWAPGERYGDLAPFVSVFKESGFRRQDYLAVYFPHETKVVVLTFHTTDSNVINYRSVIKLLARSFRAAGTVPTVPARVDETAGVVPVQSSSTVPIPEPSTATTAQPVLESGSIISTTTP